MQPSDYRALICITTCRRLRYLRRYLPHFAPLCVEDPRYKLLVSVDGTERDTIRFCDEWDVPLLYADHREGVGLAKNRVLANFPGFDYYFFIEDDVELVDASVFAAHVALAQTTDIHHFSLFDPNGIRRPVGESFVGDTRVVHCRFGGADFNFFTGRGLREVGGWHPSFATYLRGGHTEHSYRFVRAGLAPAPFNCAVDLSKAFIWHSPPAVTPDEDVPADADQLSFAERELIDRELRHVPVQTIAPYRVTTTNTELPDRLAAAASGSDRYPLALTADRRRARSGYHVGRFQRAGTLWTRVAALVAATWNWPSNPELRHAVKRALGR